tara:strand:- start:717 stop:974 length:258 start_codon:yes stop_codon:yes gene_type:complete
MGQKTLEKSHRSKQDQMNITFGQDEEFLYKWVNGLAKCTKTTRSGLVKRMIMRDYARIEKRGGQMIYPSVETKLEKIDYQNGVAA